MPTRCRGSLAGLLFAERQIQKRGADSRDGKEDKREPPAVVVRQQRAHQGQEDVAGEAAHHVEAHGRGPALRRKPRSKQRETRREHQCPEHSRNKLVDHRELERMDKSEVQRQQGRAEDAHEEQALGTEPVREVTRRNLPERIGQRRSGGKHSRLREAHLQVLADQREEECDTAKSQSRESSGRKRRVLRW